jgi:uncharacterized lipoprotein YddW (UPF0748 family)
MKKYILLALMFLFTSLIRPMDSVKVEAVRGVWLTNVDSKVLDTDEEIREAVNLLSELGFNSIFVVTWNKGMTSYPSRIMEEMTGVEIDTLYTGRDPLKVLIDEAHNKDMKVIAWFEFGFSSSYKLNGGPILRNKPEWSSKNLNGELVIKNGFEWMNGFHPEVQDFLLSLIMEVVENYDIDGIQGDDRLPAMPSEAGYDEYTVEMYKQHKGEEPPGNYKDEEWVQWRADIMTAFMKRIYETVKAHNKNVIVSMAPSVYPWSKEEYLQDWPVWVRQQYVEMISPQAYRYNIKDYSNVLEGIVSEQVSSSSLNRVYPGVLLKVGNYYPSESFLREMINENRKHGIYGEVFFFYEGIKKYKEFFSEIYNDKAVFPDLLNKDEVK